MQNATEPNGIALPMGRSAALRRQPTAEAAPLASQQAGSLGKNPPSGVSHSPLHPLSQPGLFNAAVSLDW